MSTQQQIAFCSRPFGFAPFDYDFRQIGTLLPQPNGLSCVQWGPTPPSGIVPVKPMSLLEVHPDGTYGIFSLAQLDPLLNAAGKPPGNYSFLALRDGALVIQPNWFNGAPIFPPPVPTLPYVIVYKVIG